MVSTLLHTAENHTAIITINRPQVRNALNTQFFYDLDAALKKVEDDPEVYVVVLTGAGDKAFSAGADLKEKLSQAGSGRSETNIPSTIFAGHRGCKKIVIAAVNGVAYGAGCELALACDMMIASEDASFGVPQARLGIVAGGFLIRGPRNMPLKIAMEMCCTGEPITARRAYEIGMINKVVPKERLMIEAKALAERVGKCAPLALRSAKEFLYLGLEIPSLEAANTINYRRYTEGSEDSREGPLSFLEKRAPVWKGR